MGGGEHHGSLHRFHRHVGSHREGARRPPYATVIQAVGGWIWSNHSQPPSNHTSLLARRVLHTLRRPPQVVYSAIINSLNYIIPPILRAFLYLYTAKPIDILLVMSYNVTHAGDAADDKSGSAQQVFDKLRINPYVVHS